jgi:hypothetical protein
MAKLREAELLAERIRTLAEESDERTYAILRWAVVGDETAKLMIQAEEQLAPVQLAHLKAEVNGKGSTDLWRTYRESEWRLPKFGASGPGDEPPLTVERK